MDLLLDEEDYIRAIEELTKFSELMGVETGAESFDLVRMSITTLLTAELNEEQFVLVAKLIYNIGYRDNHFKSEIIH